MLAVRWRRDPVGWTAAGAPEPAAGAERVTVLSVDVELGGGDAARVVDEVRERGVDDLSATLDHPAIRDLVGAGWRDAVELTNGGFAPTWPAHGELRFPAAVVQIDHVMVRDSVAVIDVDSVVVPDADHLGVVTTLVAT